jgi:diadenylate cyclase
MKHEARGNGGDTLTDRNLAVLEGAAAIARRSGADAVLLAVSAAAERQQLRDLLGDRHRLVAAAAEESDPSLTDGELLVVPQLRLRRRGRAKVALLEGLASGSIAPDERVVVVSGNMRDGHCELDTVAVIDLSRAGEYLDADAGAALSILQEVSDAAIFDALLSLCVEIGQEGREGQSVGLLVTLGSHDDVLTRSHQLVLNPFAGHAEAERCVLYPSAQRALREFSGMDGAFVLRSDGIVMAAGRYLEEHAHREAVPSGLGSRHRAAAGITAATRCVAFCVSQSTGDTRVFGGGRLLMTIERTD